MKRLGLAVIVLGVASLVLTGGAVSKSSNAAFDLHVGDGFAPPLVGANVAQASNGDTFAIIVTGAFDAGAKTASGTGTWTYSNGTTVRSGTFTITEMVAFQFYGCGVFPTEDPAPANFCGGRVILGAQFTETTTGFQFDGLIEVNCQVHGIDFSPPPGTGEGVKVNVRGINFNKHAGGANLYVMQP